MSRLARAALALLLIAPLTGCLKTDPSALPPACGVDENGNPVFQAGGGTCEPPPPPPPCEDCAGLWGDPHLATFDGHRYDLQAVGEFTAVDTENVHIQARLSPYPNSRTVSIVAGVATEVDGRRVTIQLEEDGAIVRVDGEPVTLSATEGTPVASGRMGLDDRGQITLEWADGSRVSVQPGRIALDVTVDILEAESRGVLGDNDGESDNDLTSADGTTIDPKPSHEDLYDVFAESWRISDDGSLFDYADGESTEAFTDRTFPDKRITLDDLTNEERDAAEAICRAAGVTDPGILDDCILDVAVTGDASFADAAAAMQLALDRGDLDPQADSDDESEDQIVEGDAVAWINSLSDITHARGPDLATDGERVFVQGRSKAEGSTDVLVAVDVATGEEVWRRDGISTSCSVAVTDAGNVVGAGLRGGPLEIDGTETLVVLDATSGDVVGQTPLPEDGVQFASRCANPIVTEGDLVVIPASQVMTAWRIDDEGIPNMAWQVVEGAPYVDSAQLINGRAVIARRGDPEAIEVQLVDGDGTIVDRLAIAGARVTSRSVLDDDGDAVVFSAAADPDDETIAGWVSMVGVDGDSLDLRWAHDIDAEAEDGPTTDLRSLTITDSLVIGYANAWLLALDRETGEVVWQVDPPGFRNTGAPVGHANGRLFDSQFGGPFIVVFDADDGGVTEEFLHDDLFGPESPVGPADMFGLVVDGRLITVAGSAGARTLVALDVAG